MIDPTWHERQHSWMTTLEVDMWCVEMSPSYGFSDVIGFHPVYHRRSKSLARRGVKNTDDPKSAVGKDVYIELGDDDGRDDAPDYFFCRLLHFGRKHITATYLKAGSRPFRIPRRCVASIERAECRIEPIDFADWPAKQPEINTDDPGAKYRAELKAELVQRWRYPIGQILGLIDDIVGDDGKFFLEFVTKCLQETGNEIPARLRRALESEAAK